MLLALGVGAAGDDLAVVVDRVRGALGAADVPRSVIVPSRFPRSVMV